MTYHRHKKIALPLSGWTEGLVQTVLPTKLNFRDPCFLRNVDGCSFDPYGNNCTSYMSSSPVFQPLSRFCQTFAVQSPTKQRTSVTVPLPRGSKYPKFEVSGPKRHTLNGVWDQSPECWVHGPSGLLSLDGLVSQDALAGSVPRPPNVPLLRALWSLVYGIGGVLKGSWGCWRDPTVCSKSFGSQA